ncbi:hypothetical protein [Clostridium sardiniense]|uniref:hypothetical protein n=1 Tax=Clostridium sardiniense TaxID=29369 RepID=UPI003D334F4E
MKENIIIEDNNILKKFFKANKKYEELIINNILYRLPDIIKSSPYKIKAVQNYIYNGKTIYEYKIPLDNAINCRVAYTNYNNKIKVFFISNTIIKREFVKLLSNMSGVSKS